MLLAYPPHMRLPPCRALAGSCMPRPACSRSHSQGSSPARKQHTTHLRWHSHRSSLWCRLTHCPVVMAHACSCSLWHLTADTHHEVQVALDVGCLVPAVLEVYLSHGNARAHVVWAGGRHLLEPLHGPGHVPRGDGCLAVGHHDGHLLTGALKLTHSLLQQLHQRKQQAMAGTSESDGQALLSVPSGLLR